MTQTPDPALAARLEKFAEWYKQNPGDPTALEGALIDAYRSDQLITLSDHTAAVQAAVAKAV